MLIEIQLLEFSLIQFNEAQYSTLIILWLIQSKGNILIKTTSISRKITYISTSLQER